MTNELPRNCEFLRASDVLRDAIGLNPDRIGKREEMRISNVLQNCGYKRAQRRIGEKNARFGNRWNHAEPPRREGGSTLQTLWQAGRNYWNHWNRLSTRNPIYIYKSIEGKVRKRWFRVGQVVPLRISNFLHVDTCNMRIGTALSTPTDKQT